MVEPTEQMLAEAERRGREILATQPLAASARYDRASGHIAVELTNGCTLTVPATLIQGLEGASADQLAAVEILGDGYGLKWPERDVHITVPGLAAGLLGTRRHMASLGGRASTPAKAAAARANGARGGRPRKAAAS